MTERDTRHEAGFELRSDFGRQKWIALMGLVVLTAACGGIDVLIDEGTSAGKAVTIAGAI